MNIIKHTCNDGSITVIVEMVGASLGIQNHVPVCPSLSPIVQITHDVDAIGCEKLSE
jgi:hypothetical protein